MTSGRSFDHVETRSHSNDLLRDFYGWYLKRLYFGDNELFLIINVVFQIQSWLGEHDTRAAISEYGSSLSF